MAFCTMKHKMSDSSTKFVVINTHEPVAAIHRTGAWTRCQRREALQASEALDALYRRGARARVPDPEDEAARCFPLPGARHRAIPRWDGSRSDPPRLEGATRRSPRVKPRESAVRPVDNGSA